MVRMRMCEHGKIQAAHARLLQIGRQLLLCGGQARVHQGEVFVLLQQHSACLPHIYDVRAGGGVLRRGRHRRGPEPERAVHLVP